MCVIYTDFYICTYIYVYVHDKHEASLYIIMAGTQAPAVNVCA